MKEENQIKTQILEQKKRKKYRIKIKSVKQKEKKVKTISETQTRFFSKCNEIDELLARLLIRKERTLITTARNERGEKTTDKIVFTLQNSLLFFK